ncbi:MAG: RNA methyltransferase [Candidatus Krumholzibacteria bacterium]|nr:RNA methyltransferase [Candidatus Krumholzibacteria bacterium]
MPERNLKITSTGNVRIKALARLRERSGRERSGLMLIEGVREITQALRSGAPLVEALFCPDIASGGPEQALLRDLERLPVQLTAVSRPVFGRLAYREGSGGIVAVARLPEFPLEHLPVPGNPLYLVVDRVEKPGNLGAIFRSADGAGCDGIIVTDPAVEISNPNVIRASLGAVFSIPAAVAPAREAIAWLRERSVPIFVTAPEAAELYTDIDLTGPSAIVLGSEDRGLGNEWLNAAERRVRIPMRGSADSLNVSVAAALVLYEALRQRSSSV